MNSATTDTRVILRFTDGTTIRSDSVPTIDVDQGRIVFEDGSEDPIELASLKAVFFLEKESAPSNGSLISVEFGDGEVIRGVAPEYNPARPGFYLHPTEDTRIGKAFIVTAAVNSIDVERF